MQTVPDLDSLLEPIPGDQPAGVDLRWNPTWDQIKEARRSDDPLESGKWAKREPKTADWRLVQELCRVALQERSKDLELAMFLTEANIKLSGFSGLSDGFRMTRGLLERYWDKGLFPAIEDGPEDRSGPFEWLNNKLVDSITEIPITHRQDNQRDYSILDLKDARRVGLAANCINQFKEEDPQKKKAYDRAIADGHISMEMMERAIKETTRASYEEFATVFGSAHEEFKSLEKVVDEKFGAVAPSLALCKSALDEIRQAVSDILAKKRLDEPDPTGSLVTTAPGRTTEPQDGAPAPIRVRLSLPQTDSVPPEPNLAVSWAKAEMLIRSGEVDKGVSEMAQLAARETTGRDRFQRKLLLAEVCLTTKRNRLARSILEELAEQIDKLQLESWESTELVASVWIKLYRVYKEGSEASDKERAGKLYQRLCRLDPWQALGCNE